jgi:hypothetical protein
MAMPAVEYNLWRIYFAMYPRGFRGDDLQFGWLRQIITGIHAKKDTDLSLNKFLISPQPKARKSENEKDAEQIATFAWLESKQQKRI